MSNQETSQPVNSNDSVCKTNSTSKVESGGEKIAIGDTPEINETSSLLRGPAAMKDKLNMFTEKFKNRRLLVDLWAIFFGIGAWVGVNSVYLQLPLFVSDAPEGWSLPSYFVVITQLGNIGPLFYTMAQKCRSFKDSYMIYTIMLCGTAAAILMAFFYKETVTINNAQRSVPMFVLVFFLALVGCTSSVLYMPYMGRFKDIYLISYLIGEGLSGFIPSVAALIQGVGGNAQCIKNNSTDPNDPEFIKVHGEPRFGTDIFYMFVFVLFILSYISFIFLDKSKISKKEYAAVTITHGNSYTYADKEAGGDKPPEATKDLSPRNYYYLLLLIGLMCMFGNGIIPSVQSYSCLPYGNVAYHLTVTLSSIANPVACFMAVFLPHTSIRTITYLSILSAAFCTYALATALLSPNPPFMGMVIGDILVISTWTILIGLISFVRLSITTVFRYQGGKSLVLIGAITQIGSLIGSIISFSLVNFAGIFTSYEPC